MATLLITGATSGLGRYLALGLARDGHTVLAHGRDAARTDALVAQLRAAGADAEGFVADLADLAQVRDLGARVAKARPGLDVLINNAGVGSWGHFADSSEAILRQVMEVNFFAPAELTRLAVPVLTRGRQPALVNIASMCGRRGLLGQGLADAAGGAGNQDAQTAEVTRHEEPPSPVCRNGPSSAGS